MALPVNGSTHLIPAYYSIYRPRKDERLTWPSWLTYGGWLTHISGHPSAAGRAQDRESSPARDRRSTTVATPPTEEDVVVFIYVFAQLRGPSAVYRATDRPTVLLIRHDEVSRGSSNHPPSTYAHHLTLSSAVGILFYV